MKKFVLVLLIISAITSVAFADYPPTGWTTDLNNAIQKAQRENKLIIFNFTGSDWCGWCQKLEKAVFMTKEFKKWAQEKAVLVFIDFPESIQQSDKIKRQNAILQQFFNVTGYPTIFVVDSQLQPRLKTGYRDITADKYIKHLENDTNVKENISNDKFAIAFKKILAQL